VNLQGGHDNDMRQSTSPGVCTGHDRTALDSQTVTSDMRNTQGVLFVLLAMGFELKALHLQSRRSNLEPHLQSILLWLLWRLEFH
jgi:hypothetical protein